MNIPLPFRLAAAAVLALSFAGCSSPAESDPAVSDEEAASVGTVRSLYTISYAPNSFVIGNAYPGWTDDVEGNPQFSKGPGNPNGVAYRWGYLFGESFDHCAWIADATAAGTGTSAGNECGAPQEIDTPYFLATYTNGMHNQLAGDGSLTHMHYAGGGCTDKNGYGNVEPWRVPATPPTRWARSPDGKPLHWRYVSKDGDWVLVHDPVNNGSKTLPNWYFVPPRMCEPGERRLTSRISLTVEAQRTARSVFCAARRGVR